MTEPTRSVTTSSVALAIYGKLVWQRQRKPSSPLEAWYFDDEGILTYKKNAALGVTATLVKYPELKYPTKSSYKGSEPVVEDLQRAGRRYLYATAKWKDLDDGQLAAAAEFEKALDAHDPEKKEEPDEDRT